MPSDDRLVDVMDNCAVRGWCVALCVSLREFARSIPRLLENLPVRLADAVDAGASLSSGPYCETS